MIPKKNKYGIAFNLYLKRLNILPTIVIPPRPVRTTSNNVESNNQTAPK